MREGWCNDDYLILFEDSEIEKKEKSYGIDQYLPGYRLVGMVGWDDFLVMNLENEKVFRVPTVPILLEQSQEWPHKIDSAALKPDLQLQGKIKWYVKPVVFGGDPKIGPNMTWISHEDHVQAVKYWNQMYSDVRRKR